MVLEVVDSPGCAVAAKIFCRCVETQCIVGELGRDEPPLFRPLDGDRDVGLALRQREGARNRNELELQFRVACREPPETRRQEGDAETIRRADAHGAGDRRVDPPDLRLGGEHLGFHALGRGKEDLAFGRQFAAVGTPDEELRFQLFLERGNPPAERRVIDAEPFRGGENLARPRDSQKYPDVVPVHANAFMDFNLRTTVPEIRKLNC